MKLNCLPWNFVTNYEDKRIPKIRGSHIPFALESYSNLCRFLSNFLQNSYVRTGSANWVFLKRLKEFWLNQLSHLMLFFMTTPIKFVQVPSQVAWLCNWGVGSRHSQVFWITSLWTKEAGRVWGQKVDYMLYATLKRSAIIAFAAPQGSKCNKSEV